MPIITEKYAYDGIIYLYTKSILVVYTCICPTIDSHASSVNPLVNPVELVRCTTLLSPTISDEDHLQRRLARAFHSMAKNSNSLFDIINGDIKGAPTTTPSLLVVPVCFSRCIYILFLFSFVILYFSDTRRVQPFTAFCF